MAARAAAWGGVGRLRAGGIRPTASGRWGISILGASLLIASTALAQNPDPRKTAATGPDVPGQDELSTWEPVIAAGKDRIITAFNVGLRNDSRIGFALTKPATSSSGNWYQQGIVPKGVSGTSAPAYAIDPTIAYDSLADDFVLVGLTTQDVGSNVGFAHYKNAAGPFAGGWQPIANTVGADFPKLVAGEQTPTGREFYVVYHAPGPLLRYARSVDGGHTWTGGLPVRINGEDVNGSYVSLAVSGAGPLYVGYLSQSPAAGFRFLRGSDNAGGDVTFDYLYSSAGQPLTIGTRIASFNNAIPLTLLRYHLVMHVQPIIAADPSNPNVLYLTYHDRTEPQPGQTEVDIDVYFRRLTLNPATGFWSAGDPVRVNNDEVIAGNIKDQFRPEMVVTPRPGGSSWIHIMFYDDRDFTQADNVSTATVNYYYALSRDGGATFAENYQVFYNAPGPGDPPVLDMAAPLPPEHPQFGFEIGEYNGITVREFEGTFEVWGSFVQTAVPPSSETDWSQIGAVRVPLP